MKFEMEFRGRLEPENGEAIVDEDAWHQSLECVLDMVETELLAMKDVIDPIVSGSITSGDIEIEMLAEGDSDTDVYTYCSSAVRTALHGAGVCTPGWESHNGNMVVTVIWDEKRVTFSGPDEEDQGDHTGELSLA